MIDISTEGHGFLILQDLSLPGNHTRASADTAPSPGETRESQSQTGAARSIPSLRDSRSSGAVRSRNAS
jgi:hypothetical protein